MSWHAWIFFFFLSVGTQKIVEAMDDSIYLREDLLFFWQAGRVREDHLDPIRDWGFKAVFRFFFLRANQFPYCWGQYGHNLLLRHNLNLGRPWKFSVFAFWRRFLAPCLPHKCPDPLVWAFTWACPSDHSVFCIFLPLPEVFCFFGFLSQCILHEKLSLG